MLLLVFISTVKIQLSHTNLYIKAACIRTECSLSYQKVLKGIGLASWYSRYITMQILFSARLKFSVEYMTLTLACTV